MKQCFLIKAFILFAFVSNGQDSLTIDLSFQSYKEVKSPERISDLEIYNSKPSTKTLAIDSSIRNYLNLQSIYIEVKTNLFIDTNTNALTKLKEVILIGNIEKKSQIDFTGSKNSIDFLLIHNYNKHILFPLNIEQYISLKKLTIIQNATHFNKRHLTNFLKKIDQMDIEFNFRLEELSERRRNKLNKYLSEQGIRNRIIANFIRVPLQKP